MCVRVRKLLNKNCLNLIVVTKHLNELCYTMKLNNTQNDVKCINKAFNGATKFCTFFIELKTCWSTFKSDVAVLEEVCFLFAVIRHGEKWKTFQDETLMFSCWWRPAGLSRLSLVISISFSNRVYHSSLTRCKTDNISSSGSCNAKQAEHAPVRLFVWFLILYFQF